MTLTSSFTRATLKVFIGFSFVMAIAVFEERARTGQWWTQSYFLMSVIPCAIAIVIVCLGFVPSRLTLTDDSLRIDRLLLSDIIIPLDDLQYYLKAPTTFMIQVRGQSGGAYQISWYGFRRKEWRAFQAQLRSWFPEREARFFIGTYLFGRRET